MRESYSLCRIFERLMRLHINVKYSSEPDSSQRPQLSNAMHTNCLFLLQFYIPDLTKVVEIHVI